VEDENPRKWSNDRFPRQQYGGSGNGGDDGEDPDDPPHSGDGGEYSRGRPVDRFPRRQYGGGGGDGGDGGGGHGGPPYSEDGYDRRGRLAGPFSGRQDTEQKPTRLGTKEFKNLQETLLLRSDLLMRFELTSLSVEMLLFRFPSDLRTLPQCHNVDMQSEENSSMLKSLVFEIMSPQLKEHFPVDSRVRYMNAAWQRVPIGRFDSSDNYFEFADTAEGGLPEYGDGSFQYLLINKLQDLRLYYSPAQIQEELDRISSLSVDSLPKFESALARIFRALTWHPNCYTNRCTPGSVGATLLYQTAKRCLCERLINDHSVYDSENQVVPGKVHPRHLVVTRGQSPLDWEDCRQFIRFIVRSFRVYREKSEWRSPAGTHVTSAGTGEATAAAGLVDKISKGKGATVAAVSSALPSRNDGTLLSGVTTIETLEQEFKKAQVENTVKIDALQQGFHRLSDNLQQRSSELGSRRPGQASFGTSSPAKVRDAFMDDKEIPASGGGISLRQRSLASPMPRSSPGVTTGGTRPDKACWAFLKGSCTRNPCKFVHWLPDESRESLSLANAKAMVLSLDADLEDQLIGTEGYQEKVAGVLLACPLFGMYMDSKMEEDSMVRTEQGI